MKKTYMQPTTEVVKIPPQVLLYTSQVTQGDPSDPDDTDEDWLNTPDGDGRLWGE